MKSTRIINMSLVLVGMIFLPSTSMAQTLSNSQPLSSVNELHPTIQWSRIYKKIDDYKKRDLIYSRLKKVGVIVTGLAVAGGIYAYKRRTPTSSIPVPVKKGVFGSSSLQTPVSKNVMEIKGNFLNSFPFSYNSEEGILKLAATVAAFSAIKASAYILTEQWLTLYNRLSSLASSMSFMKKGTEGQESFVEETMHCLETFYINMNDMKRAHTSLDKEYYKKRIQNAHSLLLITLEDAIAATAYKALCEHDTNMYSWILSPENGIIRSVEHVSLLGTRYIAGEVGVLEECKEHIVLAGSALQGLFSRSITDSRG